MLIPGEARRDAASPGLASPGPGRLSPMEIAGRLAEVMGAAGAARGADRARVAVVRDGRAAAIERFRQGRHYWVLPGGGVEEGETIGAAAVREAAEELGVVVRLGPLRAVIHSSQEDGTVHRHWCFEAIADSDDIAITSGPETNGPPEWGTYAAVWLELDSLARRQIYPAGFARLIGASKGHWVSGIVQISEGFT